jgi:hypothetical protein
MSARRETGCGAGSAVVGAVVGVGAAGAPPGVPELSSVEDLGSARVDDVPAEGADVDGAPGPDVQAPRMATAVRAQTDWRSGCTLRVSPGSAVRTRSVSLLSRQVLPPGVRVGAPGKECSCQPTAPVRTMSRMP